MKILLAEDDLTSRTILTAILEKWGYEPIAAKDGQEAWEILQKTDSPKLVLLDWRMPGVDGLEVCRRIRRHSRGDSIYVIILTSRSEKKNIVAGLDAGANDYIVKPYDNKELRARVNVGRRMIEMQMELEEAKNALAHEAMLDHLTGILNRRAILDILERELSRARRDGKMVSIGMCDLDHFKQINDRYGHQAGDEVLCGFTRTVQSNLRDYDVLGRYGGEEFLLVMYGSENLQQEKIYERLCARVAKVGMPTRAGDISITVSIGVACSNGKSTVDKILAEADTALYRAKAQGRNCVCYAGG